MWILLLIIVIAVIGAGGYGMFGRPRRWGPNSWWHRNPPPPPREPMGRHDHHMGGPHGGMGGPGRPM